MEFTEKAKIRIEHWLKHNQGHLEEYESFADELEKGGHPQCASRIREMAALTARSGDCLKSAIKLIS